jgi:hypothetical protein
LIKVTSKGSFKNMEKFLQRMKRLDQFKALAKYGPIGVGALSSATPEDSSETANSWSYDIVQEKGFYSIVWRNTHVVNGAPIAILLQYGHGTNNGGYVEGRDYINPAIRPIFDQIVDDMWKVVTK